LKTKLDIDTFPEEKLYQEELLKMNNIAIQNEIDANNEKV